jgi:TM2 domain-containing membrane protein YozV
MQTAKGRYPLAQGAGGAFDWAPKDTTLPNPQNPNEPYESPGAYVPRPDRTYSALLWSSILGGVFGLDHFYLRSPKTGVLKFLTLGGCMLWWIWDILQLVFEKKRVVTYGMTTPFDISQGIGQGMITDAPTQYSQRSSYLGFLVGILFGFLGLDMLSLGHVGQFVRKLMLSLLSAHMVYSNLIKGEGKLMNIIFGIFGVVLGSGVFISYFANLNRVFNESDKLFAPDATGGLPLPKTAQDMLNWFRPQIPENATNVRKHWMFYPISSNELRKDFWIAHPNDVQPESDVQDNNDSWLFGALGAVGYNLTYIFRSLLESVMSWIPAFNTAKKLEKDATAVIQQKKGGLLHSMEKGAASLQQKAEGFAHKVGEVQQKVAEGASSLQTEADRVLQKADAVRQAIQSGGSRDAEELSTESIVLGGTILALIVGGALKGVVDYVMPE